MRYEPFFKSNSIGAVVNRLRMKETPTRFAFRIEQWEKDAVHHLAGVEDFLLAMATYQAARLRVLRV